jgi:hypothetical protein
LFYVWILLQACQGGDFSFHFDLIVVLPVFLAFSVSGKASLTLVSVSIAVVPLLLLFRAPLLAAALRRSISLGVRGTYT